MQSSVSSDHISVRKQDTQLSLSDVAVATTPNCNSFRNIHLGIEFDVQAFNWWHFFSNRQELLL